MFKICDMNSTLGSVVPLAMLKSEINEGHPLLMMMMEVLRNMAMMMTTTTMMMIFEKLRPKNAIPRGLPPHNISFHTTKSFGEKANSALNIAATWFSSDIASPVVVHTQFRVECWFLSYG